MLQLQVEEEQSAKESAVSSMNIAMDELAESQSALEALQVELAAATKRLNEQERTNATTLAAFRSASETSKQKEGAKFKLCGSMWAVETVGAIEARCLLRWKLGAQCKETGEERLRKVAGSKDRAIRTQEQLVRETEEKLSASFKNAAVHAMRSLLASSNTARLFSGFMRWYVMLIKRTTRAKLVSRSFVGGFMRLAAALPDGCRSVAAAVSRWVWNWGRHQRARHEAQAGAVALQGRMTHLKRRAATGDDFVPEIERVSSELQADRAKLESTQCLLRDLKAAHRISSSTAGERAVSKGCGLMAVEQELLQMLKDPYQRPEHSPKALRSPNARAGGRMSVRSPIKRPGGSGVVGSPQNRVRVTVWPNDGGKNPRVQGVVFTVWSAGELIKTIPDRMNLSLIHISEPTRLLSISYAVFCLKKKKKYTKYNHTL
eukprot:TRINITY_DN28651_c0_g1_i1.p1 TRINITY_DN28651_c0_g1~~TRINITY_DN28651_c0_g1_i1.p1  ORF type:complete len:432 (+),score=113.48 TRINITY_DN28651_c0_g1_i1:291-1586(+)